MGKLKDVLTKTVEAAFDKVTTPKKRHPIGGEITAKTSSPRGCSVVCIGVSCIDMELCNVSKDKREDKISVFTESKYVPGGSCPQVAIVLAEMGMGRVIAVTKLGKDASGDDLVCACVCDCLFFQGFHSHDVVYSSSFI